MTILPLIQQIVKNGFGTYFNGIESFYLKNFLILIQRLLSKGPTRISAIASDEHTHVAHTTLTRFLQSHEGFWSALKSIVLSLSSGSIPTLSASSKAMLFCVSVGKRLKRGNCCLIQL